MKKILTILACTWPVFNLSAQTFSEWFSQKKTQIKYLHQQIAALAAFTKDIEEGYEIVQKGTATIGGIVQGDLVLHSNHFASLKEISPAIRNYERIAGIISLERSIVGDYQAFHEETQHDRSLSPAGVDYIYNVFNNLMDASAIQLDALLSLVTAGQVQLTDGERLQRIDGVYEAMEKLSAFSRAVRNSAAMLGRQQAQEASDIETGRIFYGLN